MQHPPARPFADGSVSLGLYLEGNDPVAAIDEMLLQAEIALHEGFDGVTVSEHHAGFEGYLPNPVLGASWILDHVGTGWSAACPILLPLRPVNLVVEDLAWLACRHPGRVGAGFAPGFEVTDFRVAGADHDTRRKDFYRKLPTAVSMLSGEVTGLLATDPAVARCSTVPVPVVAAVAGPVATRKAARARAGLLIATFKAPEHARELCELYRSTGGTGPRVLVRRCWLGPRPRGVKRADPTAKPSAPPTWPSGERTDMVRADTAEEMVELLGGRMSVSGATALSVRLQLPGGAPEQTREQIRRFGSEVLPELRPLLTRAHLDE